MTVAEMKSEFLTRYDAASSAASPGWEDSEILQFLNIGQANIVNTLYTNNRLELLSEIIIEELLPNDAVRNTLIYNVYRLGLPTNTMYYLDCSLHIYKMVNGELKSFYISPENINYKQYKQFISTPENRTLFRRPKAFLHNGGLNVILDSTSSIDNINPGNTVTYIKNPANIQLTPTLVNCELNVGLHKLVVEEAVKEALKAVTLTKVKTQ